MANPSELSDDVLVRRARYYGGRNLTALAVLVTILALLFLTVTAVDPSFGFWGAALSFLAITVAYWMLATAARRGDERALTSIIAVGALFIVLNLLVQAWTFFRTGGEVNPRIYGLVLPMLVLWVFSRNRADLLELRRRALFAEAFPGARPPGSRWLIGGGLLFVGTIAFLAMLIFPAVAAARQAKVHHDFVVMIQGEEKAVLDAVAAVSNANPESFDQLFSLLTVLQTRANEITDQAAPDSQMKAVLENYRDVVEMWTRGFTAIRQAGVADQATVDLLNDADQRRVEALKAFDALGKSPIAGRKK